MTPNNQMNHLFEKAISQDVALQYEFSQSLPEILSAYPTKFITKELFPFLTVWIPRNDEKIVTSISEITDKLVSIDGAILPFATVLESLLASENKSVAQIIKNKLLNINISGDIEGFFRRLCKSPLDFVRAFVPQIFHLLKDETVMKNIFEQLVTDSSFKVRFACCAVIPKLPIEIAKVVATTLCNDAVSRIKSLLPIVCFDKPFMFTSIAPVLIEERDWAVRASLAKEISRCDDPSVLPLIVRLIDDEVWQVSLCALKSLTVVLKNSNSKIDLGPVVPVVGTLFRLINFPQLCLKDSVIDAFLYISVVRSGISDEDMLTFINEVLKQPADSHLHLLQIIASLGLKNVFAVIEVCIHSVIERLMLCEQWRIRLGCINIMSDLSKLTTNQVLVEQFNSTCLSALEDISAPVRDSAVEQLTNFFIMMRKDSTVLFPEYIQTLRKANTFRKRQSAVMLLGNIALKLPNADKILYSNEINQFLDDSCDNVVKVAEIFIEKLR